MYNCTVILFILKMLCGFDKCVDPEIKTNTVMFFVCILITVTLIH